MESAERVVVLDVGGKIFKTRASTLAPSNYFSNIFLSGKWRTWPEDRTLFVDRCPKRFRHVLNLLRDESYSFPKDCLSELVFFGVRWEPKDETVASEEPPVLQDLSLGPLQLYRMGQMLRVGCQLFELSTVVAVKVKVAPTHVSFNICWKRGRNLDLDWASFVNEDDDIRDKVHSRVCQWLENGGLLRHGVDGGNHWFYFPERVSCSSATFASQQTVYLRKFPNEMGMDMSIPDWEWFVAHCLERQRDPQ